MDDSFQRKVNALVDAYRGRCLWFAPEDFYPSTPEAILRTLANIERYGDVEAFRKARELREWLSQHSSGTSVDA